MAKKIVTTTPKVCFVQFTHPGAEHVIPKKYNVKKDFLYPWNYLYHKRKFIETTAHYINQYDEILNDKILFWGEWEPESLARVITPHQIKGSKFPQNIHNPLLITNTNGKIVTNREFIAKNNKFHCQNTDPFVFGDDFYYSICKQASFTSLKNLAPGSIILFGSTINQNQPNAYFALDTVFVVRESKPYNIQTYDADLKDYITNEYAEIMGFDYLRQNINNIQNSCFSMNNSYTCYKGATYLKRVNNMYSFVPCVISSKYPQGFERIKITAKDFDNIGLPMPGTGIFTDNLNTTPKINTMDINNNKKIWDKLRAIVHQQNCLEGVQMDYRHIIVP